MTASAQNEVGKGMYDDFATVGNSVDNPTGEYSGSTKTPAEGIYWWKDAVNASDYTLTRANGVLTINVTKGTAYSPVGLGFGDTNGDGTGTAYTIDVTALKTISFKAKASTGAPTLYIQVSDAAGNNGEVRPASSSTAGDASKYGSSGLTSTLTTYTYDLTGMTAATRHVLITQRIVQLEVMLLILLKSLKFLSSLTVVLHIQV